MQTTTIVRVPRKVYVACALVLFLSIGASLAGQGGVTLPWPAPSSSRRQKFDVRTAEGLTNLVAASDTLIQLSEREEEAWRQERAQRLAETPLAEMTPAELKQYFTEPDQFITKHDRRGLNALQRLARAALATADPEKRAPFVESIREVVTAINNERRPPVPSQMDFFQLPWKFADQLRNPIGRGRTPATDLESNASDGRDLSRLDPTPSTFWHKAEAIGQLDLYHGFGRRELPRLEEDFCIYDGPKASYGSNPGFEVLCGGRRVKVKFGETTSEPFTARIFWALGYHVDPTDYAACLKIKYNRRLFREFHLRKEIQIRCTFLGVLPVYRIKLQRRFDPFDYIAWAAMNDGSRITGADLKARLFRNPKMKHPQDSPGNFRPEIEQQIDYLVTTAANVQIKNARVESIGPWDFGQRGHENLRELRGAGLLAAWLGWFDSRFENTRLKLVETGGRKELRHYFSDLGGGLGRGKGFFSPRGELPNEFGWTFTEAVKSARHGPSFRIADFKPIADTPAFAEMTIDDARWMARLIGQLSEAQIVEALVASGFDSAQVRLYTEKLISRRDRMIGDLGLAGEIALLRPGGTDRTFSYDPARSGPVRIRMAGGEEIVAKSSGWVVEKGRLTMVPQVLSRRIEHSSEKQDAAGLVFADQEHERMIDLKHRNRFR